MWLLVVGGILVLLNNLAEEGTVFYDIVSTITGIIIILFILAICFAGANEKKDPEVEKMKQAIKEAHEEERWGY